MNPPVELPMSMQRAPSTFCPKASMAPCSLCPPRLTNARLFFTKMSAPCLTFTAALMGYTSSTLTSWANTARKASPRSEKYPRSTSRSSRRTFFGLALRSAFRPKEDEGFASFLDASWAAAAGSSLPEESHCIEATRSQRPWFVSLISQFDTTDLSS